MNYVDLKQGNLYVYKGNKDMSLLGRHDACIDNVFYLTPFVNKVGLVMIKCKGTEGDIVVVMFKEKTLENSPPRKICIRLAYNSNPRFGIKDPLFSRLDNIIFSKYLNKITIKLLKNKLTLFKNEYPFKLLSEDLIQYISVFA